MRVLGIAIILMWEIGVPESISAQGHGPIFGLSTPTLRRGGWSIDNGLMGQVIGGRRMLMFRPLLSYGLTENLQLSASFPVSLARSDSMIAARVATRMPGALDAEATIGWRFQKTELGIGSRYESTAFFNAAYPTDNTRAGIRSEPGLGAAIVTGYVSRSTYLWAGAMHQRRFSSNARDRHGDATMYSAVVGMRPLVLQRDYPRADWRVFVEFVGEVTSRDSRDGIVQTSTGGHQMFLGPTVLGLFGGWGISGGPVFPVYHAMRGSHAKDTMRAALDVITWF